MRGDDHRTCPDASFHRHDVRADQGHVLSSEQVSVRCRVVSCITQDGGRRAIGPTRDGKRRRRKGGH
ncbi:hypothetical protein GTY87_16640 [Streptomyces sp. SID7813]|uniref:Uncharacterized protein n=1 Tax=Streptomyces coelicolor (strain ATCC BAA-471 / A3(2) / M145) TaxID=100226 RepID=Q9X8E0_STRCO|nr:hypothetical protein [Streptomyces sp. SID7813]QFI43331.1 hypothetical protein FQ762_16780 [Streptomyces coelicolor A3(2)]CAB40325.1 hypothetical protein [Streptomyces coelicolor A3(2)]